MNGSMGRRPSAEGGQRPPRTADSLKSANDFSARLEKVRAAIPAKPKPSVDRTEPWDNWNNWDNTRYPGE